MSDKINKVTFDRPKIERLTSAYEQAVKESKKEFTFEGQDYVTDYAKHLLEYLRKIYRQ
jgi:hypothetical protein